MIQGYTNEGNAILSLKGNVEQLRDAYKDAQKEAYNILITSGEDSDGNDIIKNARKTITGSTLGSHDWGNVEKIRYLDRLMSASDSVDSMLDLWNESLNSAYSKWFEDFAGVGGTINIGALTEKDLAAIRKNASVLRQQYQAEINSAISNVQTLANAYLMTSEDFDMLDEQAKNAASIIVNSLNKNIVEKFTVKEDVGTYVAGIVDTIQDNPEIPDCLISLFELDLSDMQPDKAKNLADSYIRRIAKALGENPLDLKIRLGFEDVDTLAQNYNEATGKAAEKFSKKPVINLFGGGKIYDPDYLSEREALDSLQSSVKAAANAYATLLSGSYSLSELLDSIQADGCME